MVVPPHSEVTIQNCVYYTPNTQTLKGITRDLYPKRQTMGETSKTEDGPSKDELLTVKQLNCRIAQAVDSAADLHGVR